MIDRPSDEEIAGFLRTAAAEANADSLRMIEFHETIAVITGPVGELLREIAHAHNEYETARNGYGTTEGEGVRLGWVLDAAVKVAARLRPGGVS